MFVLIFVGIDFGSQYIGYGVVCCKGFKFVCFDYGCFLLLSKVLVLE